mgnify:CR=1 FL=1
MRKFDFFKNFIRIEYLALLLSITAIWATYQQNITNKEFYQLSVKPLFKKIIVQSPNRIFYAIHNYGLGVAIIDSIEMNYNKKPIDFYAVADTIMANYSVKDFSSNRGHNRDFVIKTDERHDLFHVFYKGESEIEGWVSDEVYALYDYDKLNFLLNNIEVTIYYKDLYNNRHIFSTKNGANE